MTFEEQVGFLRQRRAEGQSLIDAKAEWRRLNPPPPSPPALSVEECLEVINRVGAGNPTNGQVKALRRAVEDLLEAEADLS